MLSASFFRDLSMQVLDTPEKQSNFNGVKMALAGLGIAGAAAGAYALYKKSTADDLSEDELPGAVEGVASTPDAAPDPAVGEALKQQDREATPPKATPRDDTPISTGFWTKLKGFFTMEKTAEVSKPQISKPMEANKPRASLTKKLPGEYRSKFNFSGIQGASILSAKGTYTQEEANRIIALKTSGVSTKASGSMPQEVEDLIRGYSKIYGVDEELALKIAKMESGGNPNAISSTGAIGVFQFTGGTASDYGIQNRFDVEQNIEAGVKMLAKHSKQMADQGLPSTPVALYLAHQLGMSGAKELFKAAAGNKKIKELSPRLQKAIKLNYGGSSATTAKGYIENTLAGLTIRDQTVATGSARKERAPAVQDPATANPLRVDTASLSSAEPAIAPPIKLDMDAVKSIKPVEVKKQVATAPSKQKPPRRVARHPPQQVVRTKQGVLVALNN